jgi:hypothetical protein
MSIRRQMDELTNTYRRNVLRLQPQLTNVINFVMRQRRINSIRKQALINRLRIIYSQQLQQLTRNYQRQAAELAKQIRIQNQLLALRTTPSKFALLVGINYRNSPYELFGCINDALNIRSLLLEKYNYEEKNIKLLTDDTQTKPTRQNILNELTNLLVHSISGDKLFFAFSGHGSQIFDKSGDELDGIDELIIPIDLKYILDDELKTILDKHLKEGVELFALIDSCHT